MKGQGHWVRGEGRPAVRRPRGLPLGLSFLWEKVDNFYFLKSFFFFFLLNQIFDMRLEIDNILLSNFDLILIDCTKQIKNLKL